MILQGRLYEIASGVAGLPLDTVIKYRQLFAEQGYELPPEPSAETVAQFTPRSARREKVGTALKSRVENLLKVKAKGSCGCTDLANKMDRWGIEGCQTNRETIISHMVANRDVLVEGLRSWLPTVCALAVDLIPDAILRQGANWLLDKAIEDAQGEHVVERQRTSIRQRRPNSTHDSFRENRNPPPIDPATIVPVVSERDITSDTRRNLMMHIWPTHNGAWRWNLDQILKRKDVFTGRRIIAVAEGADTVPAEEVAEYAKDLQADIISVKNSAKIREGASFLHMMDKLQYDLQSVTFFCHAKGSRHGAAFGDDGSTILPWTESMYWACLDQPEQVLHNLQQFTMTGPFRRFGNFRTPGNHRWHYSGAFYWFRNEDVFTRNWRRLDRTFFAVESWPGLLFRPGEVACCFADNVDDLYNMTYWNAEVKPLLDATRGRGI